MLFGERRLSYHTANKTIARRAIGHELIAMPKHLSLRWNLQSGAGSENPSFTQMKDMLTAFYASQQTCQNRLPDLGGKLGAGTLVTERPAPEGRPVDLNALEGGCIVVPAGDLNAAIRNVREFQGLVWPSSGVEVIEIRTR